LNRGGEKAATLNRISKGAFFRRFLVDIGTNQSNASASCVPQNPDSCDCGIHVAIGWAGSPLWGAAVASDLGRRAQIQ
jgi:hypothetical protein